MTLAILLPTRGRPGNLARFIAAVENTAEDWHLYIRIDRGDPSVDEYEQILYGWKDASDRITTVCRERNGFAASLNELAFKADADGMSHLGMFGDDVVPITPGWDVRLVEALGDDLGIAYGNDGLRDRHAPDLPTHYVTQTEVYRRLGYLAPPGFKHLFLDNVARDIGQHLGNFVFEPVSIKHMHPWVEGEHLHDQTYAEGGRNAEVKAHDRKAYFQWRRDITWRRRLR